MNKRFIINYIAQILITMCMIVSLIQGSLITVVFQGVLLLSLGLDEICLTIKEQKGK